MLLFVLQTALRTPRRFTTDAVVPEHSYIRVHCLPKRFPAYHQVSWSRRVIADGPDFVVMNKPGGVPVAPTGKSAPILKSPPILNPKPVWRLAAFAAQPHCCTFPQLTFSPLP